MSETTIVNRTPESFGQKLERERLEDATAPLSPKSVWDTPEGEKILDQVVEQAAKELMDSEGPTSHPDAVSSGQTAGFHFRADKASTGTPTELIDPVTTNEVWHLGNYARFGGDSVTVKDASGKESDFHFPGVVKSIASKAYGLEVLLEDGRQFAVAGGPSLTTMFPLSLAGLVDDGTELTQPVKTRPHAPRDPDLREFKDQVVRAFKHLGLDTRKFFS